MPWSGCSLSDAAERQIYQGRKVPYKPVGGAAETGTGRARVVLASPSALMAEEAHAFDEFESKTWSARAKGEAYSSGCGKGKDASHEPRQ